MEHSKSQHILELAKEIIDDIELQRCEVQPTLLKSTRLARYVDNEEIRQWLRFEMQGFPSENELSEKYMSRTGRWTDKIKKEGYWAPLAQVDASIQAQREMLKSLRIPDAEGTGTYNVVNRVTNSIVNTTNFIAKAKWDKKQSNITFT